MTPVERQLAPPGGWRDTAAPRLTPIALSGLSWPLRTLLRLGARWGSKRTGSTVVPDVFLLLLRHPHLFWAWLRFASKLMPFGTLDRRDAELVILRVAWNCRCRYEWGQHVAIGLRAGLTPEEIGAVPQGADTPTWSPRQRAVLQATDEIHAHRQVSHATWQFVSENVGSRRALELVMLVGHYEMLAGVLNSACLPLEPDTEARLAQAPIHGSS
ncbi:MAG: carboxymuconolactone decarboxylase family protein [Panacagrimonas sp.]|nr:carboxymuconolactone decarboxylase family protein [Panacagrimonas sp.]MCC2655271.1 carboxymuconolactone decarboxylase family protein [Panacagrimonas sp.]